MKRIASIASLALLPGCVVAAVAVTAAATYGVVKYTSNEAYRDYRAGLGATWRATLMTLRHMGYPVQEDAAHGAHEGRIDIQDAEVRVQSYGEDSTRVRVRIGTFDTEDHRRRAGLLLEGIAKRLGES